MLKRIGSITALALGAALLAGCQSNNDTTPQSSLVSTDKGVTCSKCQTTWVRVPDTGGKPGRVHGYTTKKSHACPDCRDAVSNFFVTGKLEHACKTCGNSLEICEAH